MCCCGWQPWPDESPAWPALGYACKQLPGPWVRGQDVERVPNVVEGGRVNPLLSAPFLLPAVACHFMIRLFISHHFLQKA